MRFSHIRSTPTYHKCMNDLMNYEYITDQPSHDAIPASMISLVDWIRIDVREAGFLAITDKVLERSELLFNCNKPAIANFIIVLLLVL